MRGRALKELHRDWLLDAGVAVAAVDGGQGLRIGDARLQLPEEERLCARRQAAVAHHFLVGFSQEEGRLGATELALDGEVGGERGGEMGLGEVGAAALSASCGSGSAVGL